MPKPFQRLGEIFGISPSTFYEEQFPFKVRSWEELSASVKPLREKNLHFSISPRSPKFYSETLWPPSRLEIEPSLTSEYIEGRKSWVSADVLYKLKQGKFSIKATLNIRGYTAEEAKLILADFFKEALLKGYTCVLIIHGRGLSSKGEPVLKKLVKEWCERGPFRKYILAYATARPCDGGFGATYVLLSNRPQKP